MKPPDWLDKLGRTFWTKHYKHLNLLPEQAESFAILCATYSDYRQATDDRFKTKLLDTFIKLSREFNLLPRSKKVQQQKTTDKTPDPLAEFHGMDKDQE